MHDTQIQFIPSRVEGLEGVTAATVFTDRIELASGSGIVTHRFADIARWPKPRFFWKALDRLGLRPRLLVADRDWFHQPADMFFEFYTSPPLKVFMPREERKDNYQSSFFVRIQNVLRQGGFQTFDLG